MKIVNKKIITFFLTVVTLLLLVFIVSRFLQGKGEESLIEVKGQDYQLKVSESGKMFFSSWGKGKNGEITQRELVDLVKYLKEHGKREINKNEKDNYLTLYLLEDGNLITYYLLKDDAILAYINTYFESGGGVPGGQSVGENPPEEESNDGFEFNQTPTPRSSIPPTPLYTGPTIPPDCPLWLLSLCIYPHGSAPTVSPTTPRPSVAPDCSYWRQFIKGKAVVSNTYCLEEE